MSKFDINNFCKKHNFEIQDYGKYDEFYNNTKIHTVISKNGKVPFMLIDTGISVYLIRWCKFTELMMDRENACKVAGYEGDPFDRIYKQS